MLEANIKVKKLGHDLRILDIFLSTVKKLIKQKN
jgi:hypothetical protein